MVRCVVRDTLIFNSVLYVKWTVTLHLIITIITLLEKMTTLNVQNISLGYKVGRWNLIYRAHRRPSFFKLMLEVRNKKKSLKENIFSILHEIGSCRDHGLTSYVHFFPLFISFQCFDVFFILEPFLCSAHHLLLFSNCSQGYSEINGRGGIVNSFH